MTPGPGESRSHALSVVAEQIDEAVAAKKCHGCGCLHQTVAALEATEVGARYLGSYLARARSAFTPAKYDCLGCAVCYPAVAANAFTEAFPSEGAVMHLCATEAPAERAGWPPLPGDYRVLRHVAPVAVCTLDTGSLAAQLAAKAPAGLSIVGTMRTENLGIERLIRNLLANPHVRVLVMCGEDSKQQVGHLPGQSLACLFENGTDEGGRIRGALGKRPVLVNVTREQVDAFRAQVRLVSRVGELDVDSIVRDVVRCAEAAPGPVAQAPTDAVTPIVTAAEPRRLTPDPAGYFVVYPDLRNRRVRVEHFTNGGLLDAVIEGTTPAALYSTVIDRGLVTRLDHAAYLGRELARAERSLETGEPYVQDRAAGLEEPAAAPDYCGCAGGCDDEAATSSTSSLRLRRTPGSSRPAREGDR